MRVETLATGVGFTEGPVVTQAGEIVFTSIDQGRLYRIRNGAAELIVETGGGPNGAAEGSDGCIYIAQNGGKRPARRWPMVTGGVQVVRPGGIVDYLTKDLISPNDLCFGPDGYLYVTDPTRRTTRDDGRLWRCDIVTGEAELLMSMPWYPNGIGFGLEDDALYVASTGDSKIVRFPFSSGGGLGKPELFIQMDHAGPDGFAFDTEGNVVIAGVSLAGEPSDIQTWDRNGQLVDILRPGPNSKYTNVALSDKRVLYITDSEGGNLLAAVDWPSEGLRLHPFRHRT